MGSLVEARAVLQWVGTPETKKRLIGTTTTTAAQALASSDFLPPAGSTHTPPLLELPLVVAGASDGAQAAALVAYEANMQALQEQVLTREQEQKHKSPLPAVAGCLFFYPRASWTTLSQQQQQQQQQSGDSESGGIRVGVAAQMAAQVTAWWRGGHDLGLTNLAKHYHEAQAQTAQTAQASAAQAAIEDGSDATSDPRSTPAPLPLLLPPTLVLHGGIDAASPVKHSKALAVNNNDNNKYNAASTAEEEEEEEVTTDHGDGAAAASTTTTTTTMPQRVDDKAAKAASEKGELRSSLRTKAAVLGVVEVPRGRHGFELARDGAWAAAVQGTLDWLALLPKIKQD
jgi:hypothetical protein